MNSPAERTVQGQDLKTPAADEASRPALSGAEIRLDRISKSYGALTAVRDVSLTVEPGEFLALLGPSGSGKSTILSMIAGFEQPSAGEIFIGNAPISRLPAYKRNFGMVFQRYALFPHLTVGENLAYPLRQRGVPRDEITAEVARTLSVIKLEGKGRRYSHELSGGQQQRVALGRAIIFKPPLLLMDEPLGALDKKLRQQMQLELKLLHRSLGTTIILVTHDQEEALSMAGRVAVMDGGRLQQVDTPDKLYERPASALVADFIGDTNFLHGIVEDIKDDGIAVCCPACPGIGRLTVPAANLPAGAALSLGQDVTLALRPEHIGLHEGVPATVVQTAYAGSTRIILVEIGGERLVVRVSAGAYPELSTGATVMLQIPQAAIRLYPGRLPSEMSKAGMPA